ncbi:MAG: hypothetical protein JHC85_13365 [Chthoniobacterales bacterium]|nr:hypothetical protein [Chthoniobacterales bacterium]
MTVPVPSAHALRRLATLAEAVVGRGTEQGGQGIGQGLLVLPDGDLVFPQLRAAGAGLAVVEAPGHSCDGVALVGEDQREADGLAVLREQHLRIRARAEETGFGRRIQTVAGIVRGLGLARPAEPRGDGLDVIVPKTLVGQERRPAGFVDLLEGRWRGENPRAQRKKQRERGQNHSHRCFTYCSLLL